MNLTVFCTKIALFLLICWQNSTSSFFSLPYKEERWNWDKIAVSYENLAPFFKELSEKQKKETGKPFMWGVATSAFQLEGTQTARGEHIKNNWTEWAEKKGKIPAGIACDHWNRYKEDTQLLKQTGMNTHRLSVDWSKIEPQEGVYDTDAMNHYRDEIIELKKNNIEPIVCLFHQTWPLWFDAKGAFEKEENIKCFVNFSNYVFDKLHTKVTMWMTLNEPIAYTMSMHFTGTCPPGNLFLFKPRLAGIVFKNFLNAHVAIYQTFKEKDKNAVIGFTDVFTPLFPYHSWNPFERLVCRYFDSLLHDVTLNFFKTGNYNWMGLVKDTNKKAPESLDYLGVNYYTHKLINLISFTDVRPGEELSSKKTAIYPEGLYWAIKRAATLGKPLMIGENGVSDKDDTRKDQFIKRHLYAAQKAMQEDPTIKVTGYFYWSLMNSYGWNSGFEREYGLYHVDFDPNSVTYLKRTLRDGAKPFIAFVKKLTNRS